MGPCPVGRVEGGRSEPASATPTTLKADVVSGRGGGCDVGASRPRTWAEGNVPGHRKVQPTYRQASDGSARTREEFIAMYGGERGLRYWAGAPPMRRGDPSPEPISSHILFQRRPVDNDSATLSGYAPAKWGGEMRGPKRGGVLRPFGRGCHTASEVGQRSWPPCGQGRDGSYGDAGRGPRLCQG